MNPKPTSNHYAIYRHCFLFLIPIFLGLSAATAQTSVIKGKVESSNGTALFPATISIETVKAKVSTNAEGFYEFKNVKAGTYKITANFVGMHPQTKSISVSEGAEVILDFSLVNQDNFLNTVEISTSYRKFGKKESDQVAKLPLKNLENPQVYNIVPKEILQEQVINTYNDVLKNVAGVSQGLVNGSNSFYMRGFENNSFIRNGLQDKKDNSLEVANIEYIEVLKGPSATLFGNSLTSFGGLINRVTKKPFDTFKGEVSYTVGGYDLNRITADVNTPLNAEKGLLMRTNIAYHDEGTTWMQDLPKGYL